MWDKSVLKFDVPFCFKIYNDQKPANALLLQVFVT
jgi:hypothetical protein